MQVLERYLHAVRHWLPVPQRDDIVAELSEDIRSQIEEREAESGRALEPDEVEALLQKRGHPLWVAEAYLPAQHLIGPGLLPVYRTVRMVTLAAMAAVMAGLYVLFAFAVPAPPKPELARLDFWIWHYVVYAFAAIGVQTMAFAWIERSSARARAADAWDPRHPDEPPVVPGRLERSEALRLRVASLGHFVGAVLFSLWWLGILRPSPPPELSVRLAPIGAVLYAAILFVGVSGAALAAALLARPRRPRTHAVISLAREVVAIGAIATLLGRGPVVEVAIAGAPPEGAAMVAQWLNVSVVATLVVLAALYAAEAVRDVRLCRATAPDGLQGDR